MDTDVVRMRPSPLLRDSSIPQYRLHSLVQGSVSTDSRLMPV